MDPFGACNDDSPAVEERLPQVINARAGELDPAQVRSPVPEVRRDARCDDNLRLAEQGWNVEIGTLLRIIDAFVVNFGRVHDRDPAGLSMNYEARMQASHSFQLLRGDSCADQHVNRFHRLPPP